jgi:hypothetical protein
MGHKARAVPRQFQMESAMTKQVLTNTFAKDITKLFSLSDRTTNSTLQYFTNKIIKDIKWNTDNKLSKIQNMEDTKLNMYIEHKEHGVILDNDAMLQLDNDIAWNQAQIAVNEELQAYFQTASEQLFPKVHADSKAIAGSLDRLEEQYQAMKGAK